MITRTPIRPATLALVVIAAVASLASAARAAVPFRVPAGAARIAPPRVPTKPIAAPTPRRGATLAGIVLDAPARARPGAGRRVFRVTTQTSWSAEPQVLLVLGSAMHHGRQWLHVLLPIRPDGSSGWIPRDNVVLLRTPYWVSINTRLRLVTILDRGRRVHRYRAVIGKASTPSPGGLAAIYEKDPQPDPTAFLGPWALPLTIFSNVLLNFGGGPGRVAIHGRGASSLLDPLGSARSHGCIRIDNAPITWMARHLPQGTPVRLTGQSRRASSAP